MLRQASLDVKITFYGYPDNDDGHGHTHTKLIAHRLEWQGRPRQRNNKGEAIAGGRGTYDDPITAAAREGNRTLTPGTLVYVPKLKKYFLLEDDCADCTNDEWIDLWMESDASNPDKMVTACERTWTGDETIKKEIIIRPPANLQVDTMPFYDQQNNRCNPPHGQ